MACNDYDPLYNNGYYGFAKAYPGTFTEGGKKVSLITKLIDPELSLVQKYYFDQSGNLITTNDDVQKALFDLLKPALVESAKNKKAEEDGKSK